MIDGETTEDFSGQQCPKCRYPLTYDYNHKWYMCLGAFTHLWTQNSLEFIKEKFKPRKVADKHVEARYWLTEKGERAVAENREASPQAKIEVNNHAGHSTFMDGDVMMCATCKTEIEYCEISDKNEEINEADEFRSENHNHEENELCGEDCPFLEKSGSNK